MGFRAACVALSGSVLFYSATASGGERHDSENDSRTPAVVVEIPVPASAVPGLPVNTTPGDLLLRVRAANEQLYTDLESFVCNEQMTRYKGSLNGDKAHQIDTVTARVSFENGTERYSDIRQNKQRRSDISAVPGAWSEGEFGTLLRQTQLLLNTEPVKLLRESHLNGAPTTIYEFEVGEEDSPWDLAVSGEHYRVPFRTEVTVSQASGQIVEIERTSTSVSPEAHISEIRWSVALAPVELNGRTWLLPKNGEYAVSYSESDRREWNLLTFSGYRRYGSQVAVRFDVDAEP
jgi:hypothetical protein